MAKRWLFKELRGAKPRSWAWRALRVDGSIESTSGEFKNYGAAMHDAITNGFRPTESHWVVESEHHTTHFEPGRRAVIIPNAEHTPLPSLRPLKPRLIEGKGLFSSVPKKLRENEEQ
jgi:hypothetical protein